MSKIQLRGHCQVCGRLQAATNGHIADHGYTVEHGWFSGVCQGARHQPMESDTSLTAKIVATIREDVSKLAEQGAALRAGKIHPIDWQYSRLPKAPRTPWDEIPEFARKGIVETAAYQAERRAEMGLCLANDLERLAAKCHAQPLVEVKVDAGPAPVIIGEKRKSTNGMTLQSVSVSAGRVYWKGWREGSDKPFNSWTGSAAWRRMELVSE